MASLILPSMFGIGSCFTLMSVSKQQFITKFKRPPRRITNGLLPLASSRGSSWSRAKAVITSGQPLVCTDKLQHASNWYLLTITTYTTFHEKKKVIGFHIVTVDSGIVLPVAFVVIQVTICLLSRTYQYFVC